MKPHAWSRRDIRAFSLIEVLISIVILALGLLGLAAVFPAVVRQQRQASDGVQGASVLRSAQEFLRNNARLNEVSPANGFGIMADDSSLRRGWQVLSGDPSWANDGRWDVGSPAAGEIAIDASLGGVVFDRYTGEMMLGDASTFGIRVPLVERLSPRPFSGTGDPLFVWDMALRRIDNGVTNQPSNPASYEDDLIQVAIFVRRIDAAIRTPGDATVTEAILSYDAPLAQRRVPVAIDTQGRPTNDGRGTVGAGPNYSLVTTARIDFFDKARNQPVADAQVDATRIVLAGLAEAPAAIDALDGSQARAPFLATFGQKFVTWSGSVHEVVSVQQIDDDGVPNTRPIQVLTVTPPLSRDLLGYRSTLPDRLNVLFTPQPPAAVGVMLVSPTSGTN